MYKLSDSMRTIKGEIPRRAFERHNGTSHGLVIMYIIKLTKLLMFALREVIYFFLVTKRTSYEFIIDIDFPKSLKNLMIRA